ncbi:MAG: bifunctional oligoribonuclease/PAP phosphatase NrnA [Fusobacteriaceae bacterium]|jgi:phosphoesterase RecJ-like protein|nr:bifunctional oligoribonuclease/PAP phosphatase NrnA [Fusobacteriaceae bacterium]
MTASLKEITEKLKQGGRMILTTHVNPDGDAIGATLGLYHGLKKLVPDGRIQSLRIVLQDKAPDTTRFLDGFDRIEQYREEERYPCDILVCLDSADLKRCGKTAALAENTYVVNIDHHITNPGYGRLNYVRDISSTSEIIYDLLKDAGISVDVAVGECLYTGLVNDTGNFSHDNVSPATFAMAADLIGAGVDNARVIREFLQKKSWGAVKLIGEAMFRMAYFPEERLAFFSLSYEEMRRLNGRKEDTESIVERLIEYEEALTALFLREEEDGSIKGSLRTKSVACDLSKIAVSFGGGGHKKAAGFSSKLKAGEILKKIRKILREIENYS